MEKRQKVRFIFDYLQKLFPDPQTELNYSNPFQLILAVVLSAQTTDKQVNKVTDILFKKIKSPEDIIKLWQTQLTESIKSIWLYKWKAKNIFVLSQIMLSQHYISSFEKSRSKKLKNIFDKYWYYIADQIKELQKLPGVGEKTAKVVSHVLYGSKVIAVDTHVHRISNRLGLVKTNMPEQTSKLLEKVVPNKYKDFSHHALVLFWRYYCTARKPKCDECELKKVCRYYKELSK